MGDGSVGCICPEDEDGNADAIETCPWHGWQASRIKGGAQVNRHFLKILPEHFQPVHDRMKKAELRKDDREPAFARHDELVLQEWDGEFTGREVAFLVTHALRGDVVPKGYAMLSGDRLKCSCCDGWTYMPLPGNNLEVADAR